MQIIILNRQKKLPISKGAIKTIVINTFKFLLNADSRRLHTDGRRLARRENLRASAGQLTILYTDNKTIQELNYRFAGKDEPTDVLCFDLSQEGRLIADIVISTEKAWENSRLFNTSPRWEANLYLVHGILHLLGYRDRKRKDRICMQRKALWILRRLEDNKVS